MRHGGAQVPRQAEAELRDDVDGTDASNGKPVGCVVSLTLLDNNSLGEECSWTGLQAATWYSAVRQRCGAGCGFAEDSVSHCTLTVEFVQSCKDVNA